MNCNAIRLAGVLAAAAVLGTMSTAAPIHDLCKRGNSEDLEKLIKSGANVNARNEQGETPLYIAVSDNSVTKIELLLSNGANVNLQNTGDGKTPLHRAVYSNYIDCAMLLLAKDADPTIKAKNGKSALDNAKDCKRVELLALFKKHPSYAELKRHMSLHWAIQREDLAEIRKIVVKLDDINGRCPICSGPALVHAAGHNWVETAKVLLDRGANVNAPRAPGKYDYTALHEAVGSYGKGDMIRLLLEHGADVSASQAQSFASQIEALYPNVEIELVEGGQAHYHVILGAE